MARRPTSMLFIPPRPPVKLAAKGSVILGRSRSCDLPLPGADASRRHAEILGSGQQFRLRDLGSTNGTFVNGERVQQHELHPGDRIQIGGSTITFCRVEADVDGGGEANEAKTVIFERPVPSEGEAFHGALAEIPPYAVLQILEMGRKTGVLEIDAEVASGRLWLRDGAPIHAEAKDQLGFDAALALVGATSGRFAFTPQLESPDPTIDASVTQLLLESARLLDEGYA
ncbi:MAG: FHA domain-containing protein [Myxococcales bacterium]|nr:FHA domain-containing protein [Myxococcales bacterium]